MQTSRYIVLSSLQYVSHLSKHLKASTTHVPIRHSPLNTNQHSITFIQTRPRCPATPASSPPLAANESRSLPRIAKSFSASSPSVSTLQMLGVRLSLTPSRWYGSSGPSRCCWDGREWPSRRGRVEKPTGEQCGQAGDTRRAWVSVTPAASLHTLINTKGRNR